MMENENPNPPETLYARYNEHGGVTRTITRAEIESLRGMNGWMTEYDAVHDDYWVYSLHYPNSGHYLRRIK